MHGRCAAQSKWTVKQYMCSKFCTRKPEGVGRQQQEVVEIRTMMAGVLNSTGL
jgi:hypothetical protein